jgi:hypothetical protein
MKKLFILMVFAIVLCGCEDEKQVIKNENIIKPIEEKEKYVDLNPVKLGFYDDSWNLINSYDLKWNKKTDIAWPWVFPTIEETISKENSKVLWQRYWNDYIGKGYKYGYEIKYSLTSGEEVNVTILKPSDNEQTFKYVELYIYDGLNETASWFDHLEDDELTEDTVITSIKVTGGSSIDEVVSPISLKVFTYDGSDDFDELGKYRGISFALVTINKIE